jgi:hypothetical protein
MGYSLKVRQVLTKLATVLTEADMTRPFKHLSLADPRKPAEFLAFIVGVLLSVLISMFWIAIVGTAWQFWARFFSN